MMIRYSPITRRGKKARIEGELRTPEIIHDGAVESRPKDFILAASISRHLMSSRLGIFCGSVL